MTELDKFKRRTIRSVARLLLKEKRPEEELWKEMKKETGTDCRTLWERMRALCVKKLNRMIAVDDRSATLPSIARLSLTDWLLVDLVLVHEEIDVIAMDRADNKEYPALIELFNLVQRFDIEGRSSEPLAEAWAAATVYYNRQGRQCSPMLLQRRWYQLKKLTRCRFYKFWFSYRGNTRLLEEARKTMPTRLQMAIAKRYPNVITKEYPDWEELIEKRFVIMPEEFEAKMRMPNLPKPCNSNAPDLVLVEPVIETIDLRVESDSEDHNDDEMEDNSDPEGSNDATNVSHSATEEETLVTEGEPPITEEENQITEKGIPVNDEASDIELQTESIEEDGLSNVKLISATHVPEVEIPDESPDDNPDVAPSEVKVDYDHMDNPDDEDDVIAIPSVAPGVLVDQLPTGNILQTETPPNNTPCDMETANDSDEAVDDIIKVKADEFCRKKDDDCTDKNNVLDDLIKDKVDTYLKTPKQVLSLNDKKHNGSTIEVTNKAEEAAIDLMADLNFVDDGIEFVDDGVEFVEEDHAQNIESNTNIPPSEENLPPLNQMNEDAEGNNTFDLKLLMYPLVYTTKIDQMKIFKNKDIDSVKGERDIEMALVESKPISAKSLNIKIKEESVTSVTEMPADSDDIFTNGEATDDEYIEEETVSPNSYMLKKPRTRTYDPIKICKNPDFNTKLKRLTIGFLSSTRNRQLLNACIPMTIDLSKAFESKLVQGTLYLKSSGAAETIVKQEVIEKQAFSIAPTAMPVQSLIDNSKVDIENLISHQRSTVEPMITERTKVINLPDIDKVRRINQQLLTAQVPPLRVFAGNNRLINEPPREVNQTVSIVPSIEPQPVTEPNPTENTLPKIKVEGEKCVDTDLTPETLPPAKEKLLKMINQAKISTKEALDKLDDATKANDFPMPIVVKEVKNNIPPEVPTRKHYFQPRVPLAWAPKPQAILNNFDGLLTADTLNKMLHLLMSGDKEGKGCKCCGQKKNEKKKSKCKLSEDQKDSDSSDGVHEVAKKEKGKKLAENKVKTPQTKKVTPKVVPVITVVKTKYCCWAYQKLSNRKRKTRHLCHPGPCQCCCAGKLAEKIKADEEKKRAQYDLIAAKAIVELSDDEEDSLKKACESIENVVQQSVQLTNRSNNELGQGESPVTTAVTIVDETPVVPEEAVVVSATSATPSINVEVVAPSISKVTIDLGITPSEGRETPSTPPKPNIKIRAAPIASLMPNQLAIKRIPIEQRAINRPPQITVNRTPAPRFHVNIPMNVKPKPWAPCSCQPALSQNSRKYIVIDASKNCAAHPTPSAPQVSPKDTEIQHSPLHLTPIASKQISPQKRIAPVQNKETPIQKQEKILYLHSKSLAKSPSESPIFLGKNKILLTTVKFPRKNEEATPPTEVCQSPKVIPTLPLPAGVQLVLMPSGNVTYTLDPGVELSEAQLATLPTILAAVQEQLNASGVTTTTAATEPQPQVSVNSDNEPVSAVMQPESSEPENTNLPQSDVTADPQAKNSVTDETTEPPTPATLETNEVFQDTELPTRITNTGDIEPEAERTKADALPEHTTSGTSTSDLEKVTEPILDNEPIPDLDKETASISKDIINEETIDHDVLKDIEETLPSAQTASAVEESQIRISQETQCVPDIKPDDKGGSNKKNLLSDLMEMSGISAEDATAPEPLAIEPLVTNQVQRSADIIVNDEARTLPELSPVTSFAELKYACEQNGKFFKLDFETGVIVPINVCIKKNPKNKTTPTKTKEFIDLTDDVESSVVESLEKQDTMNKSVEDLPAGSSVLKEPVEYLFNGKTVNVSSTVKPVKLFKAYHQIRPEPPRLIRRASPSVLRKIQDYESLIKRTHIEKRKQTLRVINAKVEAKIDLVDSDEPMEEEYLVDSSDDDFSDDGKTEASRMVLEALESLDNATQSDDSSDDEPLAKKSKRLKEVDESEENVRETNIFDEIPDVIDPNEPTNVANDLVPDTEMTTVNTKLTDQEPAVRQASVSRDSDPTTNKEETTPNPKTGEPPAKVKKISEPLIVKIREYPDKEIDMNDPVDDSEDADSDKSPPELRFFSDHSEGGDDDCILGF